MKVEPGWINDSNLSFNELLIAIKDVMTSLYTIQKK
jgi:hypothetical protein